MGCDDSSDARYRHAHKMMFLWSMNAGRDHEIMMALEEIEIREVVRL